MAYIAAVYIGASFASLSVLLIEQVGWREDYEIFGVLGIVIGVILLTVLQEPERGRFDKDPTIETTAVEAEKVEQVED